VNIILKNCHVEENKENFNFNYLAKYFERNKIQYLIQHVWILKDITVNFVLNVQVEFGNLKLKRILFQVIDFSR